MLCIQTNGCLLAEIATPLSPTLKLTACIEDGRQEPGKPVHSFGKIGVDYERPDMTISADVDIINGPSVQGCALLNFHNRLRIGGEFLCNTHFDEKEKAEIIDCNIGASLNISDVTLSVRTVDLFDIFRFGYVQRRVASLDLDLGAQVNYRIRNNHQRLTLGGKWRYTLFMHYIARSYTNDMLYALVYIYRPNLHTELKAKVDSDLVISTSFSQDILPFMRLSLCTMVSLSQRRFPFDCFNPIYMKSLRAG